MSHFSVGVDSFQSGFMVVLVTGGNGFIGKHLVKKLRSLGHEVFVVDIAAKSDDFKLNICLPDLQTLMLKLKPQVVYHLAADSRVSSPTDSILKNNVIGTYNVLEASRLAGVKQFILTSSAAVYGEVKLLPVQELWPTKPISAYGLSKLTDELYCGLFQKHFLTTIFRFANVYGPEQNSTAEGGVVAIFIKKILAGKSMTVFGTGKQTRDFVFVADVVEALTAALQLKQPAILNIGTHQSTSVNQLIKILSRLSGRQAKINYRKPRLGEIDRSLFSFKRAKKLIGWRPKVSLEEGLNVTINANLAGIK